VRALIYFDNAATTWPKPADVVTAVAKCMESFGANPGRSGHSMSLKAAEKVYECRETAADFFGLANPGNVIFTPNATYGLNLVIRGIIRRGDHVICTCMDHNSVLRTLYSSGVVVSEAEADSEGYVSEENIRRLILPDTRLIVMTHISNVCGTVLPVDRVAKLAHENGIPFLLDASQSAGIIDIDVSKTGIDYLVCPGHKSLYGPMGTGIVCINTDLHPEPLTFGGTGSYSQLLAQPGELPDRYESGTLNLPGICGMCEGIKYVRSIGTQHILNHELALTAFFLGELSDIPHYRVVGKNSTSGRTGVVSIVHQTKSSQEVAQLLNSDYNIAVRSMYHCAPHAHQALGTADGGTVRISSGVFTTLSEVKTLLYALEHI